MLRLMSCTVIEAGKENMDRFVEASSYMNFLLEYFGEHK